MSRSTVNASAAPILELRAIRKHFDGRDVLCGIDLVLADPGIRVLMGPNGSGKTTLINIVAGTLGQDSGTVCVRGCEATGTSPSERRRLGVSRGYQYPRVMPSLTVADHLSLARRRTGSMVRHWLFSPRAAYADLECEPTVEALNLSPLLARKARDLSHGEQKLLDIAISCAGRPSIILLDEPTSGLDACAVDRVRRLVAALAQSAAVLIVDHDTKFIAALHADVSLLYGGRIVITGCFDAVVGHRLARDVYFHNGKGDAGD